MIEGMAQICRWYTSQVDEKKMKIWMKNYDEKNNSESVNTNKRYKLIQTNDLHFRSTSGEGNLQIAI